MLPTENNNINTILRIYKNMVFVGILVAFVIFSIVVLVHEYGHFKAARLFRVKVEEFGLGIPPRAKKLWKDSKGTLFSLNWLPLGGFVKIAGENPRIFLLFNKKGIRLSEKEILSRISKDKKLYNKNGSEVSKKDIKIISEHLKENHASYNLSNKPAWQQSIIILAGVFMNFLLASVIFSVLFFVGVKPIGINNTIPIETKLLLVPTLEQAKESGVILKKDGIILFPIQDSIAEQSGVYENDLLLRINNQSISEISEAKKHISENAGNTIPLYLKRTSDCIGGAEELPDCFTTEYLEIPITIGDDGKIGSYLGENLSINPDFEYKYSLGQSLKLGVYETYGHITLTLKALRILSSKIFFPENTTDRKEAVNQLSGPIGIVDFIADSISGGVILLVIICAIISVNLGVFNLLPIPALDGGRFFFIIINSAFSKVTGNKGIPQHIEGYIHVLFFMLLIALSFAIAYNDIVKILTP